MKEKHFYTVARAIGSDESFHEDYAPVVVAENLTKEEALDLFRTLPAVTWPEEDVYTLSGEKCYYAPVILKDGELWYY